MDKNKMKFLPVMLVAGLCAFTACGDKNGEKDGESFSQLKPEEHKKNIETEGINLVNELSGLANLETFEVMDALMALPAPFEQPKAVSTVLNEINSLKNEPKATVELKGLMLKSKTSATQEFKEAAGIYTWNAATNKWDKKASETEITFKFPLDRKMAEVSVSKFRCTEARKLEARDVELPLSLNAHVKLDEKTLVDFKLTAEWDDNDIPTRIVETVTLEKFSFESNLTKTETTIKTGASFKAGELIIYANEFKLDGNFNYDEILDAVNKAEARQKQDAYEQEIISSSNIRYQLGNITAEGILDVKGFQDAIKNTETDAAESHTIMLKLLNQHAKLYVRYADSNEIIAKGEFYSDGESGFALHMVFADQSKVNVDTFFEGAFEGMITDINKLIEELNKSYDTNVKELAAG